MLNKNNLIKRFPIFIFIIVIIIVINGCFFIVDYNKSISIREEIISKSDIYEWNCIEDIINRHYALLSSDSKFLSKKIEAAILREYASNLDKLKEDFDNKKFDEKLYDLFKAELQSDAITQNHSFNIPFTYILGFKDNLLAVFSDTNKNGLTTNMAWTEYFGRSQNTVLTESLIQNILTKKLSNNILLYQVGAVGDDTVTSHDISSLKKIYEAYGIEGFKNFEFVNVSYITEYGDIFGSDDYLYMENVSNHKMIIVKTSNVYSTIIDDINAKSEQIALNRDVIVTQISDSITRKSLEFITITLCLVILIIFSSVLYNKNLDIK